ncbi:MAG: PilZ domain-containing protein [Candidatus Acidiferrales bacterium]
MSAEDFRASVTSSQATPHEERRRSQRVTLRVGVTLHVSTEGKPEVVPAFTADVSLHGALLISPRDFSLNDRFVLEHNHSRQRMGCRVTRKVRAGTHGFQVGVEFDEKAPGFWHIVFPPADWKADEP